MVGRLGPMKNETVLGRRNVAKVACLLPKGTMRSAVSNVRLSNGIIESPRQRGAPKVFLGRGLPLSTALALCGWFGTSVPATSADLGPRPQTQLVEPFAPPNQWQFSFTPYGWMTSINGNVTARGHTVDIDESFFEIVEKSDSLMALMGYFEARKGPFALFTDVVWEDLTFDGWRALT